MRELFYHHPQQLTRVIDATLRVSTKKGSDCGRRDYPVMRNIIHQKLVSSLVLPIRVSQNDAGARILHPWHHNSRHELTFRHLNSNKNDGSKTGRVASCSFQRSGVSSLRTMFFEWIRLCAALDVERQFYIERDSPTKYVKQN